jgi:predicted permease
MNSFMKDLRYGVRLLLKTPGFTIVAILTLALGIGANVALFSVVDAVLLRPLPYPHPEQLVRVFDDLRGSNTRDVGMSVPQFWDYRDRSGIFQDVAVIWPIPVALTGVDKPQRIEILATSPNYFTMLGAHAQIGRVFTMQEDVPGFIEEVVLSDGFWRRQFGSDPTVLGKSVRLDGDLYNIIGVMPPDFHHPGKTLETEEDGFIAAGYNANPFPTPPQRNLRMLPGVIGRIKPVLKVSSAQAQLQTFDAQLAAQYPDDYPPAAGWTPRLESLQQDLVGDVRTELFVLLGAVGFVLLIACVNLANLLLARGTARQREIAIRLALGAGHRRLISQLLTESVLLSFVSGIIAIIVVFWVKSSLLSLAPADLPRLNEVHLSASVLLFGFFVSIVTGVLFGLVPAIQAVSPDHITSLREGSRGAGSSKRQIRISRFLVASEVALALVLLAGAGLLLRSFWLLLQVRPGFDSHHVLTAQIWMAIPNDPKNDPYREIPRRASFHREVLRRISALPGVEEASISSGGGLPLAHGRNNFTFTIEGRPADSERAPVAEFAAATPSYFNALRIPLLSGRSFTDSDDDKADKVVLIDETLAHRYWPNESPIGKRIKPGPIQFKAPWVTIIGIVGDIKSDSLDASGAPHVYVPLYQNPPYYAVVYLRTAGDPGNLGEAVRREVLAVDPNIPTYGVRSMDEVIRKSVAERRFALEILAFFATVALALAAIGIYGVMAYTFSRRAHEIGIRMALGAQQKDILRMALGEGMSLVAIGLVCGFVGALVLTRLLRTLLYNVTPSDPFTFAAIAAILAGVALLACLLPARRATQVDPLEALREE